MSESKSITLYKRNAQGKPIFWSAEILGHKIILSMVLLVRQVLHLNIFRLEVLRKNGKLLLLLNVEKVVLN